MSPAPYDPERQTYTNDLGRSDYAPDPHPGDVRTCSECGVTRPGTLFCRWCNALLDD